MYNTKTTEEMVKNSNQPQQTELTFNGINYLFKEDDNNQSFKIYVDGEIEKTMIHISYFPITIEDCNELIINYQLDY